jgi:DNA-binding MarR family transcriptional regulator
MKIAQVETAINSYHAHVGTGKATQQCHRIMGHIVTKGGDHSIGEIAKALDMEKSTVSARIFELLHEKRMLIECPHRKDKVSGITIRPVGIRPTQSELFH